MVKNSKKTIVLVIITTLIIVVVLVLIANKEGAVVQPAPLVVSVYPGNETAHVEEDSPIKVTFEKDTTEDEKSAIVVKSNPVAKFSHNWASDTVLEILPANTLQNDTEYKVYVYYNNNLIKETSFKTNLYSKEELKIQGVEQSENDSYFNEDLKDVFEQMPWLEKLPIKTPEHTIVYDFNRDSIRIRLLIPSTSSENEKASARQNAIQNLTKSGINTETIPYFFIYQDE